jgi:sugar lactone lactonase YvrE
MKSLSLTRSHASFSTICATLVAISMLHITGCVTSSAAGAFKQAPTIASFTTSFDTIPTGSSAILSWTVNGATSISIDSTGGPVTGANSNPVGGAAVSVSPTVTTTYTLTATNPAGSNTASVTVNVVDQLQIISFTANPTLIAQGQSSTLKWNVTGATQIIIDSGVGDVTGSTSTVVTPSVTTTYNLTAIGVNGTRFNQSVTVTVVSPPVIASFTANPAKISTGQSSTLQWNVVGATTGLTIDNGIGDVTGKTSIVVSPTATTTYTLTATDTQGGLSASSTLQTTVTFSSSFVPTVTSFTASAASVDPGHGVALTAVFDAGPGGTATIDNGVGPITSGVPVSTGGLNSSVTFTLTVANGANSVTGQERIIVGDITQFAVGVGAPLGLAVDTNGNVFVADSSTSTIRMITPAGVASTFAGIPGQPGTADGPASQAQFNLPQGVAVDAQGNVFVADSANNTIRMITGGMVSTLAGTAGVAGSLDGIGTAAQFNGPNGLAVDAHGNIFVADSANNTIRMIAPGGTVTTLAGNPDPLTGVGFADGVGAAAKFHVPNEVAIDTAGNIYVADSLNRRIRKVTQTSTGTNGVVTTLAGSGNPGHADGVGIAATFGHVQGLTVDTSGNPLSGTVYVTDPDNFTVRRISAAGLVETIIGQPGKVNSNPGGPLPGAITTDFGIAIDPTGKLYVSIPSAQMIITTPF